jgi:integrase
MTEVGEAALAYAASGYAVFPLRGKLPVGNCPACEPHSPHYRPHQANQCGHELCHGLYAATSDPDRVARCWARWPQANIGARVPASLLVVDVDPRHGGLGRLADLEREHGPLPPTRVSVSGRGDGGHHRWFLHPGGRLSAARLGAGVDLKTDRGYVLLPPSRHPATAGPTAGPSRPWNPPPCPFEHRELRAITVTVVRRWQNELKAARGRGTVMAARSILYRILQAAEDERLIVANPVRKVPAPKLEVDPDELLGQGKRRALTPEEAGQLLARFPPVWWDHVVTLLGTGLRFGELGGLCRRRVLLDRTPPVIQVVATRYQAGRFGSGLKGQPKSQAGIRTIPLAHQVAEAVRRQLPQGAVGDDLVFADPFAANPAGGRAPLSRYLFRHVYHRAVNRLTDPTSELSSTTRRVLRTLCEHGPQTLAQIHDRFSTPGAKLRPATIQAALRELGAAGAVVTAVSGEGTARWAAVNAAQVWRFDDLDLHGPHDFRHTFATWLEDAGIPGRVIDELMGHDNTHRARQDRVSRIGIGYRDTTPEMLMRAVAAIESRLAVVLEVAAHETKSLPGAGEPYQP